MISLLAKVAGIVIVGGISCAGFTLVKGEYKPEWTPLAKDEFFEKELYFNTRFGGVYKNYMVGVNGNKDWWNWSFERLLKDEKVSRHFQAHKKFWHISVNSGYSPREVDLYALNQVCGRIYKSDRYKVKKNPGDSDFSLEDVWKYCSALGEMPKTISDVEGRQSERYNKESVGYKVRWKLVDTRTNDLFWKIRNQEFYVAKDTHLKYPVDVTDAFFYEKWLKGNEHIRDICEEAYHMRGDESDGGATEEAIIRICAMR